MTREDRALLMMAEKSTHTIGSGVTISERRDQEVGLYRIRNCARNRERYNPWRTRFLVDSEARHTTSPPPT